MNHLRKYIRQILRETRLRQIVMEQIAHQGLEVYDGDGWVRVSNEREALEWAADQLTSAYYGRPTVMADGTPTPYAYVDRYSFEIGSSGPLLVYCTSKKECEIRWQQAIGDI